MKKKIFSNMGLKIMAVLVAFLIWLMVVNGDDPVNTAIYRGIPVTVKNADVFMEKVKKVYIPRVDSKTGQELDTVTVYVKAKRSILNKLTSESFTVTADFENIVEDLNSIPLDISCNTVPTLTMRDMWCDLRSFKVDLENVKEANYVVSVQEDGTPATDYQVGSLKPVDGESVAIAGPESDMNKIGKVVVTVDVGNLKRSTTVTAPIKIYDKNEELFRESQMERLTVKTVDGKVFENGMMDVNAEIWRVKSGVIPDVEVEGTPADGYRIAEVTTAPESISLAGNRTVLSELGTSLKISDQVFADNASSTFSQEVNLRAYLEENYGDDLKLEKDMSDIIVVTVQIERIGATTMRIPVSDILIKGKPEKMSYNLTPADYISMEIQPKSEEEVSISPEDIQVTLDLSDPKYQIPGNYQVPLEVILPEGYTLTSQASIAVNLVKVAETATEEEQTTDQ